MAYELALGQHAVTEPKRVRAVYDAVCAAEASLPAFCVESQWQTHAIIAAVDEMATELGVDALPVTVSATGHHEHRTQLPNYAEVTQGAPQDPAVVGFVHMMFDLDRTLETTQNAVLAVPHLDHCDPRHDAELIDFALEHRLAGTLMYDASYLPDEENLAMTKAFVERAADRTLVEGICEQILEPGEQRDPSEQTDLGVVVRFVEQAKPYLVVANLGTEHRQTSDDYRPEYRGDIARALTERLGRPMLVLHGSSSLSDEGLQELPSDGVVKINLWTRTERLAVRAMARFIDDNREKVVERQDIDYFPLMNSRRAYIAELKRIYREYMLAFGYERLADQQAALRAIV